MKLEKNQTFIMIAIISSILLGGGFLYFIFKDNFFGGNDYTCGNLNGIALDTATVCFDDKEDHGFADVSDNSDRSKFESYDTNPNNPLRVESLTEDEYKTLPKVTLSDGNLATTFNYQEVGIIEVNGMNFVQLANGYYPIGSVGEEVATTFDGDKASVVSYSYAYILEDSSVLLFEGDIESWKEILKEVRE